MQPLPIIDYAQPPKAQKGAKKNAKNPKQSPVPTAPLQRRHCVSLKQLRARVREFMRSTPAELLTQLYPMDSERKGYLMLGPAGTAWDQLLEAAYPLRLKSIGSAADPKEWDSVALVWLQYQHQQSRRSYQVLTASGQVESGTITPEGIKDGSYVLYHGMKSLAIAYHQTPERQLEEKSYPYEKGAFFYGLPCGRFTVTDENGTKLCAGCYELIVEQNSELTIDARELVQRLGQNQELHKLYRRHKKALTARQATGKQQFIALSTTQIVVRYDYLSRTLPDDAVQGFSIGPHQPTLTIERKSQETWLAATCRTHQAVLRLVDSQVAALHAAQAAAHSTSGGNWLGTAQPQSIVTGCEQGGYGQWALNTMAGVEGKYLRALLQSAPDEPPTDANPAGYFLARNNRIVAHPVIGKPIPLWPVASPKPPQLDAASQLDSVQLDSDSFAWCASGASVITGATGASLGQVWYSSGRAISFTLFNEAAATGEELTCTDGILQPSMRLELYQDFRARFPVAILTVDLITGQFAGLYELLYDIDELFAAGYHRVLLDVYGDYTVGNSTKQLKRLSPFNSSTDYRREKGVYEDGEPRTTETFELEQCRSHWGY